MNLDFGINDLYFSLSKSFSNTYLMSDPQRRENIEKKYQKADLVLMKLIFEGNKCPAKVRRIGGRLG
jgi:hypothetical protein